MSEESKTPPLVPEAMDPLPPHHYPLWIKAFAGLLLLAFVLAGITFPNYFQAAKKLKQARNAFNDNHFDDALQLCNAVLVAVPNSQEARILLAEDIFAGKRTDQYQRALDGLEGIKLEKYDWEKLQSLMPPDFQKLFTAEKS